MKDSISCFQSLHLRRIMHDKICMCYRVCSESNLDVARDCQFAMQIWSKLNYKWPTRVAEMDFNYWLNCLFVDPTRNNREEIAITVWVIWYVRNKLVHQRQSECREGSYLYPRI